MSTVAVKTGGGRRERKASQRDIMTVMSRDPAANNHYL